MEGWSLMIESTTLASAMWLLTAARSKLKTEQMNLYQELIFIMALFHQ